MTSISQSSWLSITLISSCFIALCHARRTTHYLLPGSRCNDMRSPEVDAALLYTNGKTSLLTHRCTVLLKADDKSWMILFDKLKLSCNVTLKFAFSNSKSDVLNKARSNNWNIDLNCLSTRPMTPQMFHNHHRYMLLELNSKHYSNDFFDFSIVATSYKDSRHGHCSSSRTSCHINSYVNTICIDRDVNCDRVRNCYHREDELICRVRSRNLLGNMVSGIVTLFIICVLLSVAVAVLKRFGCIKSTSRNGRMFGWPLGRRCDAGAPSSGVTVMRPVAYTTQNGVNIDNTQPDPQPQMFTGAGYGFGPSPITQPTGAAPVTAPAYAYPPVQTPSAPVPGQQVPGYTQPVGPPPSYSAL